MGVSAAVEIRHAPLAARVGCMLKALIEFGVIGVEGTLENIDFACELVQGSPDQRDLHVCVCVCVCV